jgi:hypothetical protein
MSNQLPDNFDDFMAQISASLSSASGEAALRRINAERVLRLVLEDLVTQRHDLQIRAMADRRIAGQAGADVLLQIDDYDVRLLLMDAPKGKPELSMEQVQSFRTMFEENPSTEALVISWTIGDLPSQKLSLQTVDFLFQHSDRLGTFLRQTQPLGNILVEIASASMKLWESIASSSLKDDKRFIDIRTRYQEHLNLAIHNERSRPYRKETRKVAANVYSESREKEAILNVLSQALDGEEAGKLVKRLITIPRRGGR